MNKKTFFICLAILLCVIAAILIWHFHSKQKEFSAKELNHNEIVKIQNDNKISITIQRYEVALFSMDTNEVEKGLEQLSAAFPSILIEKGCWNNKSMVQQLMLYLRDPFIREVYKDVMKKYPSLSDIEQELNTAFSYYLNYFPNAVIPKIYTLIPGLDFSMPSVYAYGDSLFINLDMYLGASYKNYALSGMPKFISQQCEKKYISVDCFSKALVFNHLSNADTYTLLDNMIYQGKIIYFTHLLFPELSEMDLMRYSPEKYDWAVNNHGKVWNYLIENDMLFSKNADIIFKMTGDNPFTKPFSNSSPGKMGVFIGWKIVNEYMKNNSAVSIQKLLQNTDYKNILNKSKYKPSNR